MIVLNQNSYFDNLPSEWNITRVDKLFEIQQGKQVSKKTRQGENQRPFLRTKNLLWGRIDLSELDHMHFNKNEEERLSLRYGDLLLCEGGDVGRTSIWKNEIEHCYYQNHLHRLRALNKDIFPGFALYWFWYAFQFGNVYFGRKNVTTIPNMSKSRLGELPIPYPHLLEQQTIAGILSLVQRAIEEQERLIALTKELKKALMHKLFTEGTRGEPQKQTEIGPIPQSWEVKPFEEFTTLQRGKDLIKSKFSNGNITVAGSNGVIGYHDTSFVKGPGVTVGRSGSAGKVTLYKNDFWAHNTCLYVKDFHNNDPIFAFYYLEILNLSRFKTGASVPTLDRNSFKQIPIAFPSKEEQVKIAYILESIDKKIEVISLLKSKYEDLFRTLLHELMTAKIRVNDLNIEKLIPR